MKNNIQYITRYFKTLMFTMLVGIIGFEAGAQIFISSTPPATPWYAGQEATASYEAEDFDAGTTFILWDDADNDTQIDEGEQIFGESTVQDALEEIDFSWPQAGNVNLRLAAFSGNSVTGEIISFTNADVTAIGTNSGGNFLTFDRASARSLTTDAIDLDTSEPVVLSLTYDGVFASGPDAANPVEFLYSTDGFATAGTALTDDNLAANEFENIFQVLEFTLPNGAKTANTSFRIQQKGTVDYGTDKNWQVRTSPAAGAIQVEIGETYTNIQDEFVDNNNVLLPELTINTVLDADDVPGGTIFPGDEITVEAELQGIDLTGLDFAVRLTNTNTDETFLLENQTPATVDNGTKEITVVGTVPTNISYYNAVSGWDVDIYAFEGTEILFGTSEFYNFTGGLPADFEQTAGDQNGSGLVFDQSGERSVTTSAYSISTENDGVITFNASRKNDILSPAGTDMIVEYATNGGAYTALRSVDINSLSFGGTTEVVVDGWPAGVVSESTQFRIRQASNNGANLDAFIIADLEIQSGTNLISETFIGRGFATSAATVQSPNITINNIDVGGDGQAFPMEELTLTYDITAGAFPTNTPATAFLQRAGQPDIIIGETEDITSEFIDLTVPPIVADDYIIYIKTLNDEEYLSAPLAIYDLGVAITSVDYTDPVIVAGDEFTYPGSGLTVNYSIQGTPGAGAELMMSVYDNNPDVDDWVMIGSTTTLGGTITATLPTGIDYNANPDVRLSIGSSGIYDNVFNAEVISENFENDPLPETIWKFTTGTSNIFPSKPDSFTGSGVRSATTVPFSLPYGGNVAIEVDWDGNGDFTSNFDVRLEGSTNGTDWEELDVVTVFNQETLSADIPNALWSENVQFRVIYSEAFELSENVVKINYIEIYAPEFMEVSFTDAPFDLILPSLAVNDYDQTLFAMGKEVSINYNALGFPAATDYAAVVGQNGEFVLVGTSSDEDAGTIDATMPIGFGDSNNPYDLTIVPYQPETAGGEYKQGETVDADQEKDFPVIEGQSPGYASNFDEFEFSRAGERSMLTREFDLSDVSSARLDFNYGNWTGSIDQNANKNTVPRLEASTDGGATFEVVPVYELEDGEEQIYDDGLLHLSQSYSVEIPTSLLGEDAVQFRWSQPLNLGEGQNEWYIEGISVIRNDDNRVPSFTYESNVNGNNPKSIDINAPSLGDYTWMQADLDDAVFNGETFNYSWDIAEGLLADDRDDFPAGTEFKFYLRNGGDYVIDPETGLPYVIGSTTGLGEFEGQVPFFVLNALYDVMMSASVEMDEETFYVYGGEESGVDVGDLNIFLRAAELEYQGDPNATLYAGQDVTFSINIENDETNLEATTDLFANLIFDSSEGDILLATQQGMGDITIALPTDYSGTGDFRLELSEGATIAEVGTILENQQYADLEDDADNFITIDNSSFPNVSGRRLITTRDIKPSEIEEATLYSMDVSFNQLSAGLTASQYVIFEYSTDNGATYTELQSYPETDAEATLSAEGFVYAFTADMKENGVRFRWRQEEAKGNFSINKFDFTFGETMPFDYVDESIDIAQQVLMVTNISATEGCLDNEVTLDYEIKGRFGADNVVTVDHRDISNSINSIDGYEFNLNEGTGQVTFEFAGNTLSGTADNGIFKFRLSAEDETTDNTVNVDGNFSETYYELVSPINPSSSFTVNDPLSCLSEDVTVSINAVSMQDYFLYEVLDAADGTVLGSLFRDPEDYQNEINIGQIAASTDLELRITSQSSTGTVCNTLVVDEESIEVLANFELYSYIDSDVNWKIVAAGSELTTCDGAAEVSLSVRRLLEDGSLTTLGTTLVEWFRDDLNNLVTIGTSIDDEGDIEISGAYFARVTTNSCVYTTESIQINVVETPAQPAITVVSGDLEACSSADPVVLSAPEGFAYYEWSNGANSRTISVEDQGSYSVQVANMPFGTGCSSDASTSVNVDRYHVPDFAVRNNNTGHFIGEGEEITICDNFNVGFMDGASITNNGNVQVIKDGNVHATVASGNNTYKIDESGTYSFVWNFNALNVEGCTAASVEFTVNIAEQPTAVPALASTGNLTFCENEGTVTLTAPAGSDYYRWSKNGSTITSATQDFTNTNTIEVSTSGSYTVEVGNAAGCYSPQSNAIVVTVIAEPSIPGLSQVNTTCGADEVEFSIFNGNGSAMTYQLYNGNTGEVSGNPVTIQSGFSGIAVTDIVEEDNTPFYVEVSYADGTGCSNVDPSIFTYGNVRNITLEMEGSRLIVKYGGSATVRWYRNGVLLVNSTANSIHITDNADYAVEVEYTSGCIDTSSPADLPGDGPDNGRSIVGMNINTYPNPSSSQVNLNIVSENMGKHQLVITSISGQVMKTDSFDKNSKEANHTISIDDLQSGIYRLRIQYGGQVESINIIKN